MIPTYKNDEPLTSHCITRLIWYIAYTTLYNLNLSSSEQSEPFWLHWWGWVRLYSKLVLVMVGGVGFWKAEMPYIVSINYCMVAWIVHSVCQVSLFQQILIPVKPSGHGSAHKISRTEYLATKLLGEQSKPSIHHMHWHQHCQLTQWTQNLWQKGKQIDFSIDHPQHTCFAHNYAHLMVHIIMPI